MGELKLSEEFSVPLDLVTETVAVLGQRGSGKTHAASVVAEEVIGAGHPAVVIDPLGVWWGLRSSAAGSDPGLPVVIFGGDHADVPLTEQSGAVIAEAVVADRFPAILDLSLLSKAASRRFMTEFIESLYHRNREALHVFVDEADLFAPQRNLAPEAARLLGAMEDLVRRGRARGLGCTLITQRPAVLNKDVLSQASVLVALRMTGKHDVAAIDEWVRLHADEDEARTLKSSLPSLPVGTAWFWSPGWLGVLAKVPVRARTTFDSSATPKVGESRRTPTTMAAIDLEAIGQRIAAAVETTKANDPKQLKATIARLEQELEETRHATVVKTVVETVVDPAVVAAADDLLDQVNSALAALETVRGLSTPARALQTAIETAAPPPARDSAAVKGSQSAISATVEPGPRPADKDVHLKSGARRLLETLARQHPQRLTKAQLATLAKFKVTGGTFGTYWSQLRRLGFIDERGTGRTADYTLTAAGFGFLGESVPAEPLTGRQVIDSYAEVLKAGARAMLEVIVEAWPAPISREDLAAAVGMTATGGTFGTYLGVLRRNGLIDVDASGARLIDHLGEAL